jgi:hybrid cluster-associated redox disulfide protein
MMPVEATLLVDDVMRQWPMTIRAFLKYKMHCVGCPITCFHTISDACREHGVDQAEFLSELGAIIAQSPEPSGARERKAVNARWPA